MKQQVPSSNGHGSSIHSKSQAQVAVPQTRTSRAPPPKVKQPPATPGPGVKARPRPAAAMVATRRQPAVPVTVRRVTTSTTESETVEEEVVRLRGEVDALRREVQRLLRLNQHQQHDAATNNIPQPPSKISISGGVVAAAPPPPPPPPPPPLPRYQNQRVPSAPSTSPVSKATALVEMYNSLQTSNKKPSKHTDKSRSHHQHSSIVDELQNRSRHQLAIKEDVETKAEFINHLINKIHTSTYTGVEQVVTFVDWLDQHLSTLSDETAVLKHFNWPERKADALREAASEYRHLKCLLTEISSLRDEDDGGSGSEATATRRKISSLLDKLEKSMDRLVNLRRLAMPSYKEFRIPTDWMLDSGMASKMRLASVSLAKMYTKTVLKELDCRDTAGTGNEAALVAQSVRFTYRVHQFAGGLDCEAMHAFEELRKRVQLVST